MFNFSLNQIKTHGVFDLLQVLFTLDIREFVALKPEFFHVIPVFVFNFQIFDYFLDNFYSFLFPTS